MYVICFASALRLWLLVFCICFRSNWCVDVV